MTITPEIEAKWRSEFEAIAFKSRECLHHSRRQIFIRSETDGVYVYFNMQASWQGFLMARESVVIELPAPLEFDSGYDEPGLHYWPTQIKNAIESQGYRVKGDQ